ncbi:MAG: 2-oxoacid:acceptor oxidoreductase family protein [Myxococcota bacterium]
MTQNPNPNAVALESVVIRFAGDSGDGMQLLGDQFTRNSALVGNDIATLPDFPAEIRAPAGTREGVSGFQLQFSQHDIFTPGDDVDVLVAMNPAALARNLAAVRSGGLVVVNGDNFQAPDLAKAKLDKNPFEDGSPQRLPRGERAHHHHHDPRRRRARAERQAGRPLQELLRARHDVCCTAARWTRTIEHVAQVQAAVPRGEHRGDAGGGTTSPAPSSCSRRPTRCRGPSSRRASTATSPATRRWRSAW